MKRIYLKQACIIFTLIIITLHFSGCTQYAYKEIQVLDPPSTNLFLKGKKVTILQNSYRKSSDTVKGVLLDTIHRYALDGFKYSLEDYGNISYDVDSATKVSVTKNKRLTYYDWQKLDSISKIRNSEIIFIHDASDVNEKTDYYNNDQGFLEVWKDIYIANRWVIIDPVNEKVLKEEITVDTLTYLEYGIFVNSTKDKLPKLEDVLAEISWETGRIYAEKYIPTWQNRNRLYFDLPNDGYTEAIKALRYNELNTAAAIFSKYAEHKNDRIAALSKYNMAVVCELKGEYEVALEWLRDSYKQKQYYSTEEYIKIIKRRITETEYLAQ